MVIIWTFMNMCKMRSQSGKLRTKRTSSGQSRWKQSLGGAKQMSRAAVNIRGRILESKPRASCVYRVQTDFLYKSADFTL